MQIVFHLGVHSTDHDKLLKGLLKSKGYLAARGTVVPGPGRYRNLIRKTISALDGARASSETQEALLDAIIEEEKAKRVVLSNENFICIVPRVFDGSGFYPQVTEKIVSYTNLFHGYDLEFMIGICNPATHIPELCKRNPDLAYDAYLSGSDPLALRWSSVISQIREANPEAPITVWCNEDTPLIWSQILEEMAGNASGHSFEAEYDLLAEIMSAEGMKRFMGYLETHPPQNDVQKRRIIAAFLDKFANDDAIEVEIDLPNWDEAYVAALTANYEHDLTVIQKIPNIRFLHP
jgi:hypothetical protein